MLRTWFVAVAALVLASCSTGQDVPAAEREATKFRQMLATGQYAEIYRGSAEEMRQATPEPDLTGLLEAVNTNLGKFESAPAPAWKEQEQGGKQFVSLEYDSKYERGTAKEKFVFRIDAGKATLAGYEVDADFNKGSQPPSS